MLTCIDDTTNGSVTTFLFSDDSSVSGVIQHHKSPPFFKIEKGNMASEEQKTAIKNWSIYEAVNS